MAKATPVAERVGITKPVLKDEDLRLILDISISLFYRMKGEGKFDGLMCKPQLTKNTRYSGALVQQWVDGGSNALARRIG